MTRGTLMPNAQRHEVCSDSQPPSSGPSAVAAPMVEPQTANAWPRDSPVNDAFKSDSEVGRIRAAPAAYRNRATSSSPLGASPASRLVAPNVARMKVIGQNSQAASSSAK